MHIPRTRVAVVAAVAAAVSLLSSLASAAPVTFDTTTAWDHDTSIGTFGEGNLATFGQTFTTGNSNILQDFTFYLRSDNSSDAPVTFAAYLARWGGNEAFGPILFESTVETYRPSPGLPEYTPFTFETGGLTLQTGTEYVVFMSASNFFDGVTESARIGYVSGSPSTIG